MKLVIGLLSTAFIFTCLLVGAGGLDKIYPEWHHAAHEAALAAIVTFCATWVIAYIAVIFSFSPMGSKKSKVALCTICAGIISAIIVFSSVGVAAGVATIFGTIATLISYRSVL